ncbi:MAG: 5-formyltetrahydrofolate cyclo-ligase [Verrucomicrobiales bacterium]|nr:5-formyltetrahydrofolate cyclo-ligase [Verrucomicrobiales bacterium]
MITKKDLRLTLREETAKHSAEEQNICSQAICIGLAAQEVWRNAKTILFYMPIAGEPDIWPLAAQACKSGKTIALPRYTGGEDPYHVRQVRDLTQDLECGQFGIMEPSDACPILDVKLLDFVLVPGIGFGPEGQRLGRGKGYYDRLLAKALGIKCGVAFDWQITASIPTESHDVFVNCIVTPTLWLQVESQRV